MLSFRVRWGIVILFILLFLISAPLLVLYTAGYRYNFRTGSLEQTGIFYITSIPKGVEIIINDEARNYTPAFIKNLLPGEYQVSLAKEGYHTWSKTLPIASQDTTFVEDVVLFLDSQPVNLIKEKISITELNPSTATFAYAIHQASWYEIWTYSILDNKQSLLYRISAAEQTELNLEWSASGEYLLIEQKNGPVADYIIIDRDGENPFNLTNKINKPIQQAWWHPTDEYAIMFTTKDMTGVYRIVNDSVTELYDAPVLATLIEGRPILTETIGEQLAIFSYTAGQGDIIAYVPQGTYQIIASPEPYLLLHDTAQQRIVLINTSTRNQPILLNTDALGIEWAPDNSDRLLYWSALEAHIYNPTNHSDELITRVGEPLNQAAWHPLANVIFTVQQNKINAIELDWRDKRNEILLAQGQNLANLFVDPDGKWIYFTGTIEPDAGIFKLQILER